MPLRLYVDHDSSAVAVVRALRERGIDVLTTQEAGLIRVPDGEQLAFATAEQRTLYTANRRDFARIHKQWMREGRTHTGIIVRSRQQVPIGQ
jgi:hypothetical protein